ncbi:hypothetical protein OG739_36380 [Streptomyces longwoodensis]|nr:hypothetical protein [Streptomyces longwoodensis]MCX5000770.1 hypothetical protein [Streptomyces longwoodensis]
MTRDLAKSMASREGDGLIVDIDDTKLNTAGALVGCPGDGTAA